MHFIRNTLRVCKSNRHTAAHNILCGRQRSKVYFVTALIRMLVPVRLTSIININQRIRERATAQVLMVMERPKCSD